MASIRHALTIAAPADRIRALVSSAEGFSRWWAEDAVAAAGSPAVELGFFNRTTMYRLVPSPDAGATRWACETGQEWAGTEIVFRLQPKGDQTQIEFAHERWAAETPYFVSCNTVWGHLMFKLKDAAEHPATARPYFTKSGVESSGAAPAY